MILEIPDVDLTSLTDIELDEHASLCAQVDNKVRSYHIYVQSERIRRLKVEHEGMRASGEMGRLYPRLATSSQRKPTAKEIIEAEQEDDDFSLDSFK